MKTFLVIIVGMVAAGLAGCVNVQAYFKPLLPEVSDSEIAVPARPIDVKLEYQMVLNGVPDPKKSQNAAKVFAAALERTKVFNVVKQSDSVISVETREKYDEVELYAKARAANDSLGAAGSISEDDYAYTISFKSPTTSAFRRDRSYKIGMIVGNRSVPEEYKPINASSIDRVFADAVARDFARELTRARLIK